MKYNTNEIYCFDDFIRRGRGQASENFPGKIKNRIKIRSTPIGETDPVLFYSLHSNSSPHHLVRFIQNNQDLYKEIVTLYEEIDKTANGYKDRLVGDIGNALSKGEFSSVVRYSEMIVENCIDAVVCRKTALINVIMKELLSKKDSTSLVCPIRNLNSDKVNELANFRRLFWYSENKDISFPEHLHDYDRKKIMESSIGKNYKKVVFQRFAVRAFEAVEEWFIEILSLRYTNFKSPLDRIWIRQGKSLPVDATIVSSIPIEDEYKTSESLNLALLNHTDENRFNGPWGICDIYGLVPTCSNMGFNGPLSVTALKSKDHLAWFHRMGSSPMGLPNSDDYERWANSL